MTNVELLQLNPGEEILWSIINQKGFFKKKVVGRIVITNRKVIINNSEMPVYNFHYFYEWIIFKNLLPNVVVLDMLVLSSERSDTIRSGSLSDFIKP